MANQFETAFIPQQPILRVEGVSRSSEPVNLALILSLVVFFVTITVAVGVYLYRAQIDKRVVQKTVQLEEAEKDFNIDEITTYKRIDSRLSLAKKLVDEHTISSVAFDLLESSVAQNVGLTALSFAKDAKGNSIALSGQAPSYAAVYFQIESWRAIRSKITSVEPSPMSLDEKTGIVSFSVKLTVDPQYLESLRVIEARSAPSHAAPVPKVSETATSTMSASANISIP
jgi:Tfp pilus assembly protein PilN